LYIDYYPKAAASRGDEIYTVLIELFSHLKDGHMYLELEGGQQMIPWIPFRRKKDLYSFNAVLIGRYFNDPVITCEEHVINYQILPQNIGYLNIQSFSGAYYLSELPHVFRYFSNTIGIIVDIRHNYGGDIHNVDKLVRNFIETPIPRNPYFYNFQPIEMDSIYPGGPYTYQNPGVLLINGVSYSASEITAEIFKQKIPHITLVGDTTGGGSLGYLNAQNNGHFRLPSGKLFHIGNLDVRKYNGIPFENIGIVPDILVSQSMEDINTGHDQQLEFAIALILKKTK
jgi:C-terminal processing protease CtpA/Prc